MKLVRTAFALMLLGGGLSPVLAHHSAAIFDFTKVSELSGEVKAIRVINPHMSLTLAVTDQKGSRDIDFEGHSINNFYRAGWRPNMIKLGDHIKIRFAPRKDGADGGFVNGFVTAQGQEVSFGPPKEAIEAAPADAPRSGASTRAPQ